MPFQIFEGYFDDLKEASGDLSFYDSDTYLKRTESNLKEQMKSNNHVYEYIFAPIIFGLTSKLIKKKKLRILDYGGGVGLSYLNLAKCLEDMSDIEYVIYDSHKNCKLGRKYLSGEENLHFFSDFNLLNFNFDLIHLGSVIQYIEDLRPELCQLLQTTSQEKPRHILISDAYVGSDKTFVTTADYYGHKHPCKFRSWSDLLDDLSFFNYKLKAKIPFIAQIHNHFEFYDMSNMPKELRIKNTWHLFFESEN